MGEIARYLNELIVGNVFDSPEILDLYSSDRSIVQIRPKAVALPESTEDISKLLRFCNQLVIKGIDTSVTIRGSGLDEMGGDLGDGIVISTEKLNRLLEIDWRERLVRVQAGITLRELNTALSMYGLTLPVGGHKTETIGGLISNCPADYCAGKYGGIAKYIDRIEVVLANGDILQTNRLSDRMLNKVCQEKTLEGKIYRNISKIVGDDRPVLEEIRQNEHSLAGYPNIIKIKQGNSFDLAPLFFGAEGTLGVISEVILHGIPMRTKRARIVATFKDFTSAQKFLDFTNNLHPCQLDFYDISIIKIAKNSGKKIDAVNNKLESGFVVFAKFNQKINSCLKKVSSFIKESSKNSQILIESPKNQTLLNDFENSLTSFIKQLRSGERVPIAVDFYLPSQNISSFLEDLKIVEKKLGLDLKMFGSYAASNYSLRPKFNLKDEDFARKALTFLRACAFIINRQGGSIAGGSPEGRIKSIVTNSAMSEEEKKLYSEIKDTFDPKGILNRGIKLTTDPSHTIKHFRTTSSNKIVL